MCFSEFVGAERWTREQVLGLAPDASSATSGTKLGKPDPWSSTGATATAVWGACQGSGKRPYQTVIELAEPAYKCSCPSRKFPCKHALGLLLLWSAGADGAVPDVSEPADFALEWLASRQQRREQATERASAPARDPERAARTAAQRGESVAGGVTELRMWLVDQVHAGLAGLDGDAYARVDPLARRLVDAKAPGLAARVRRLPESVVGVGWPERLLREFGLLWLLVRGHERLAGLPDTAASAVRRHVGYPVATADVLTTPAVGDTWTVLGSTETEEDRITTRKTWLRGDSTGRWATIIDFKAPGGPPLPMRPPVGAAVVADLAFYPDGLRALPKGDLPPGTSSIATAATTGVAGARADRALRCAEDPWLTAHPVLVTGRPAATAVPHLVDAEGDAVPLTMSDDAWWLLLAHSSGADVTVAGLLDTAGLLPLSVVVDEAVAPL